MSNNRNRPDSLLPSHMTESNPSSTNLGRDDKSSRGPRVPMDAGGFRLAIPAGAIPADKVGITFERM